MSSQIIENFKQKLRANVEKWSEVQHAFSYISNGHILLKKDP